MHIWKVPSRSKPGHEWLVREVQTKKGVEIRCSCPKFIFKRKCHHLSTPSTPASSLYTLP